jgi:hypothetical protein
LEKYLHISNIKLQLKKFSICNQLCTMKRSPIHQIIDSFEKSFNQLKIRISDKELERLGLLVYNAMIGSRRKFHTPEHPLNVMKDLKNPLQKLAVLFHDVVYFQVDDGFPPNLKDFLEDYAEIKEGEVYIKRSHFAEYDTAFRIVLDIFGFSLGQKLSTFQGLNEFLSAVVAIKYLEPFLTKKQLAIIAVSIELTIPFRPETEIWSLNQIYENLKRLNQKYFLDFQEPEIENAIKLAVEIANADVLNFSDADKGRFLDNTWLLIFETNNIQTNLDGYSYSVIKYREGIMKTEGFINNLNSEHVFKQYKGVPNDEIFNYLKLKVKENLEVAKEYLQIKLLVATILEAFAIITGDDVPVALLTGGIRNRSTRQVERAEDHLPAPTPLYEDIYCQPDVLNLLEQGRSSEISFDMKNSPLSSFVYRSLGSKRCKELMEKVRLLYAEKIYYYEFLEAIEKPVLSALAKACAKLAVTRAKALSKYF